MSAFDKLLEKISVEEYRKFIAHYAVRDPDFKTAFEIYFSDKDENPEVEQKYVKLVRRTISKYSDRGYVDYRSSFGLSGEINALLRSGVDLVSKSNFRDGFIIARVTLKELMNAMTCCDDSAGCIGGSLSNTIEIIETVATAGNAAPALKEEIFMFLEKELSERVYFEYGDFGYDLFNIYREIAVNLGKEDAFLVFVERQASRLPADSYSNYEKEFLIKQKIEFFHETHHPEKANLLTAAHLDIVELRMAEVDRALSQNNLEQAKRLIREGIRIAKNKQHPGTVAQWEKELWRVAELENDVATIRHYAKYFAFDCGFSKEAYNKWKTTYLPIEWRGVIDGYIREKTDEIARKKSGAARFWSVDSALLMALAPVCIEEQYWDRLMDMVKKANQLDSTLNYHKYLKANYADKLLEIYLPAFEKAGGLAGNRKDYAELVVKMKEVLQDIPEGEEAIRAVARKLRERYPRRPAMLDELKKL